MNDLLAQISKQDPAHDPRRNAPTISQEERGRTMAEQTVRKMINAYGARADEFQVTPGLSDDEWARMIGINLNGTFHGARAAAKRMIEAGKGGVIINIQSTTTQKVPAPVRSLLHCRGRREREKWCVSFREAT